MSDADTSGVSGIYALWLNPESTVLVRVWESGRTEVCLRDHPDQIWGPPIEVTRVPPR